MTAKICSLEVRSPGGEEEKVVELRDERLSVGRRAPGSEPDLALDPDPQCWVSRLHCVLESDRTGRWWLTDESTLNGTFLRRDRKTGRVKEPVRLKDCDEILILGESTEDGPLHWQLTFLDPNETHRADVEWVPDEPVVPKIFLEYEFYLEYDPLQRRLFRHHGGERTEITGFRFHVHKLIDYMARRNSEEGCPVVCNHAELIWAIWEDEPDDYRRRGLHHLVMQSRQTIESDPKTPRLLETFPREGYKLIGCEGKG